MNPGELKKGNRYRLIMDDDKPCRWCVYMDRSARFFTFLFLDDLAEDILPYYDVEKFIFPFTE